MPLELVAGCHEQDIFEGVVSKSTCFLFCSAGPSTGEVSVSRYWFRRVDAIWGCRTDPELGSCKEQETSLLSAGTACAYGEERQWPEGSLWWAERYSSPDARASASPKFSGVATCVCGPSCGICTQKHYHVSGYNTSSATFAPAHCIFWEVVSHLCLCMALLLFCDNPNAWRYAKATRVMTFQAPTHLSKFTLPGAQPAWANWLKACVYCAKIGVNLNVVLGAEIVFGVNLLISSSSMALATLGDFMRPHPNQLVCPTVRRRQTFVKGNVWSHFWGPRSGQRQGTPNEKFAKPWASPTRGGSTTESVSSPLSAQTQRSGPRPMSCRTCWRCSGVTPANQTKERPVHELFAGAFRNKNSMWIVLVFPRKNTRIHKNGRNSWTFRFCPFFGLVCRGDSWMMTMGLVERR